MWPLGGVLHLIGMVVCISTPTMLSHCLGPAWRRLGVSADTVIDLERQQPQPTVNDAPTKKTPKRWIFIAAMPDFKKKLWGESKSIKNTSGKAPEEKGKGNKVIKITLKICSIISIGNGCRCESGISRILIFGGFFKEAPHDVLIKISELMVLYFKFDRYSIFSKPSCPQKTLSC